MLTSPPEIFAKANQLKIAAQDFVMASVIAVRGAASAKTGTQTESPVNEKGERK